MIATSETEDNSLLSQPITQPELAQHIQTLERAVVDRQAAEQAIEADFGAVTDPQADSLAAAVAQREADHYQTLSQLEAEHNERVREINGRFDSEQANARSERQSNRNVVEKQAAVEIAEVNKQHDESRWVAQSVLDETSDESPKRQFDRIRNQLDKSREQQQTALEALQTDVQVAMADRNWSRVPPAPPEDAPRKPEDLAEVFSQSIVSAREALAELQQLRIPKLFVGMRPLWLFVLLLVATGLPAYFFLPPTMVGVTVAASDGTWIGMVAVAALLVSLLLLTILYTLSSMQLSDVFSHMQREATDAEFYHERWGLAADVERMRKQKEFDALQQRMEQQLGEQLQRFEAAHQKTLAEVEDRREDEINHIEADFREADSQLAQRRQSELTEAEAVHREQLAAATQAFHTEQRRLQAVLDQYTTNRREQLQAAGSQMAADWNSSLQSVAVAQAAAQETSRDLFLPWNSLSDEAWEPPKQVPVGIRLGQYAVDLDSLPGGQPADPLLVPRESTFPFPTILPFPNGASLLMLTDGPASRKAAVQAMQVYLLRMLTLLPPGKLRLTIFDPVGLGESFSGLMHLADFDELLITSRIWTETAHIEARLAELTEHMENVLQKYLRNEFSSIEAYNDFAGEVAEPYHVLVVADFPNKISEQAARRLTSIATSGPRCGVYLLMSADPKQPTPHGFHLADVETSATTLTWLAPTSKIEGESEFDVQDSMLDVGRSTLAQDVELTIGSSGTDDLQNILADAQTKSGRDRFGDEPAFYLQTDVAALARWPIVLDAPPPPETFTQIVKQVGEASKDVRRVEVSFGRIAPPPEEVWSKDSRGGIDIPLGRAGATKLQHLRLGKGTSQHMLVAGKTGSGKSTFFHALITNAALHYSPDELEFYLVDFKKGVEFKAYAGGKLPHARVIAIESDREFGISVLHRLDAILHERGELFREAGVQDIAGYRNHLERKESVVRRPSSVESNGDTCSHHGPRTTDNGQSLPRIMLVIDEFQEFFTEDDRYSQQSALLLDRLVRQGRAFGIHVVLGSQTLGGAYSLARSTLGQVAVRVALQCSEADAHLILSESNSAARLLTRPGEAIYNDSNGTVEGNNPFQIAWLPDEQREGYLGAMQHLAEERSLIREPAIVFEGNIPSDPANNDRLTRLIESNSATDPVQRTRDDGPRTIPTIWLGDAVEIGPSTAVAFPQQAGSNLLLIGQDSQSARGILATSYLALATQLAQSDDAESSSTLSNLWLFDGNPVGSAEAEFWKQLSSVRPEPTRIVTPGNLQSALSDLMTELDRREEMTISEAPPMFVIVGSLSKFRDLRKGEDDYGFSGFGSAETAKPADPAKQFADLIARGPEQGIHVLVWVDSANNLDRWLSRQSLKEFELRILFAMNAGDSSNLIDSPTAAKLGPHRALLYREETGTTTKFRPYGPPSDDWLARVRRHLSVSKPLEQVLDLDGFRVT